MKPFVAFVVFILAIGLSAKSIAAETNKAPAPEVCTPDKTENCAAHGEQSKGESHGASHGTPEHGGQAHGGGHNELSTKMNSLFPEKQKDPTHVQRPEVAKLVAPKFLDKVSGTTAKLQWSAGPHATTYHVQVATDPNFKWLVANELNVAGTSYDLANLEAGKRYFWRVASVNAENESMYTKSLFVSSAFDTK
ncbi:MAG: fibronectin type III domain-containing protein [Bdellovibrio sp.]|nr:fibronectin type III domain-containing protein [Bdellovibrio sp.]